MTRIVWDKVGDRTFETGVDHGVLYLPDGNGGYPNGVPWNGLTTVTESPSGADAAPQYADNRKYLNLVAAEQFGATIEAFTYPVEFEQFDGIANPVAGVSVGQQGRKEFGLSYRTLFGNDVDGTDHGYKLHLVYGCLAAPSEKSHTTVNDTPEAMAFSWTLSTNPVDVTGLKPTATLTINSTEVDAAELATLEDALYGTAGADPRLPLPDEVIGMFGGGTVTTVETQAPTYDPATDIVTIPSVAGVEYLQDGNVVPAGPFGPITEDTVFTARPAAGYRFTDTSDTDWTINFA